MTDKKSAREIELETLVVSLSLEVQGMKRSRELLRGCLRSWSDLLDERSKDCAMSLTDLREVMRNAAREIHAVYITTN